jgi:hypothetical protein
MRGNSPDSRIQANRSGTGFEERSIIIPLKTTACFIDTNVFYDYVSIENIKWLDVLKAEHVLIVMPPVTFRELNDHKDSGTKPDRATRAGSTLRYLDKIFETGSNAEIVNVRSEVDLYGWGVDAVVTPPLNPNMPDDQLLACILLYKAENADERVVLITSDRGLKIKARMSGVEWLPLPDNYKTAPTQDPRDKKIKVQEALIEELRKAPESKLDLTFENGEREMIMEAKWEDLRDPSLRLAQQILRQTSTFDALRRASMFDTPGPPPLGTMYLEFILHSTGTQGAENLVIFIQMPEGCAGHVPPNHILLGPGKWFTGMSPGNDHVQYSGPELIHGLTRGVGPIAITFPDPERTYEFSWTAHAQNMREARTGVLHVIPKPKPSPLSTEEKEADR